MVSKSNFLKVTLICIILVIYTVLLIMFLYIIPKQIIESMKPEDISDHAPTKSISRFYKGTPKNGIYIKYLKKISNYCKKIIKLEKNMKIKNRAIALDFDDTLVWTKPHSPTKLNFKYTSRYGTVFCFPQLFPIVSFVKKAKQLGYYIFIITSRPPSAILSTIYNIEKFKIPYDAILTSSFYGEHPIFKSKLRRLIETHDPKEIKGLNTFQLLSKKKRKIKFPTKIVLTIGDNWYDIYDGVTETGIKLPSPNDFNSYVYHKNKVVELI
jgi:hypothetical protein